MILYALVSEQIGQVIDFYPSREEAEAIRREVLQDEPEWEGVLYVEPFEFETSEN